MLATIDISPAFGQAMRASARFGTPSSAAGTRTNGKPMLRSAVSTMRFASTTKPRAGARYHLPGLSHRPDMA